MGEPKTGEALNFTAYNEAFARAYAQLVNEETLICAHTGREIKPLAAPDAVVMDVSLRWNCPTVPSVLIFPASSSASLVWRQFAS